MTQQVTNGTDYLQFTVFLKSFAELSTALTYMLDYRVLVISEVLYAGLTAVGANLHINIDCLTERLEFDDHTVYCLSTLHVCLGLPTLPAVTLPCPHSPRINTSAPYATISRPHKHVWSGIITPQTFECVRNNGPSNKLQCGYV